MSLSSAQEILLSTIAAGLGVHLVFKRTETHRLFFVAILALLVPAVPTFFYLSHASAIHAITTVFPLFWGTLLTSILTYRLSPWHPLASYPGPVICKISKFYMGYVGWCGKQHLFVARLHEIYGDVVRVGPNELAFRDPDVVLPMIGPNGLPKGPFWDGRIPEQEVVRPLIAIRDKNEHLRRRRAWTRAFSSTAMKGYEPAVIQKCSELLEALMVRTGKTINLSEWIGFFTYDTMNYITFSDKSLMIHRGADPDGKWHLLKGGQSNAIFMGHVPWLGGWMLRLPYFARTLKAFRADAKQRAIQRKKGGSPFKDLFYHLMDIDTVTNHPPSAVEVVTDGGMAIIAGADTTSTALGNLFFFLMTHPVQYQRLQAEIDAAADQLTDHTALARLPYLNATINECLRILPPLLTGSQRMVPSKGQMLGPYPLPGNTIVTLSSYSIHRDPRSFSPLPNHFLPERWLPEEQRLALEPGIFKDQDYILNLSSFYPFSLGQANCAGKNLALAEIRMVVSTLLHRLEFRLDPEYNPKQWYDDMMDHFITQQGPLPTILTTRRG